MMSHRKKDHLSLVRECVQFQTGNCRFEEESCWFQHVNKNDKKAPVNGENRSERRGEPDEQVFQKVPVNLEPPLSTQSQMVKDH